jgi:IPT/TIG domain
LTASTVSGAVALALSALMLGAPPALAVSPTVTSINPTSGPATGGTSVKVRGTGFVAGATVRIGSEATEVKVVTAEEITARTVASAAGADEVVVKDTNGSSTGGIKYTYVAPPIVESITPNQGPTSGGTSVKIKGKGFLSGSTVTIGSAATEVVVVSAEEITAKTPAGSGTPEVIVTDVGGASGGAIKYTYVAPPIVESITPNQGPTSGGTSVKIKGKRFLSGSTVTIGSAATEVVVVSAEEITAKTPAGSGTPEVIVTDVGGSSTLGPTYAYFPAPTVVTGAASPVTQTSEMLNATVNPNAGAVSECRLEYGTTLPSATSAPCTPTPGSGTTVVAVSATVTGLIPNTAYRFRIVATSPGGTSQGAEQAFTTLPNSPTTETIAPSAITQTSAILKALVNPNGGEVSECKLEYGTTLPSTSSAPCTPSPAGTTEVAVSASVTGLLADTTYRVRVVATSLGGTSHGAERTFTTLPNPPTAETSAASSLAPTSATLDATVNPNAGDVSDCKFEYGKTVGYGSTATCLSLPGSGSSPIAVLADITGLTANTTYHYRIVAANSGGTSAGTDQTFTTPANTSTVTVTIMPGPTPIVVHVTPPSSSFRTLGAVFNPASHMITFTESVTEPGTFRWLLTFQNGKFGLFGPTAKKCKGGFIKLGGKCRPSKIVFARGSSTVTTSGAVTFVLKPTSSAMKALKNAYKQKKSLPVAMTLTFQSVRSTSPVSRALALTVRTR